MQFCRWDFWYIWLCPDASASQAYRGATWVCVIAVVPHGVTHVANGTRNANLNPHGAKVPRFTWHIASKHRTRWNIGMTEQTSSIWNNPRYMTLRSAFSGCFGLEGKWILSAIVPKAGALRTVCIVQPAYSVHCAICFHVLHLHVLHGRRYRIQCHHYHQAGINGPLFRHISHTFHLPIQPRHTEEIFLCLGQRPGYPSFFSVISMMWGRMRNYHIFPKKW